MKVIDLIKGMYEGELPSTVSFNMYGDRYTAYYNTRIMKLKIEDYNQNDICITNYYDEIEILDNDYLEEETKKEDLINHLVNDCDCIIEDTPKEEIFKDLVETDIDYNLIREDKKIEKLKKEKIYVNNPSDSLGIDKIIYRYNNEELGNKINEIIDRLNGE